jgi:hypothetical protein
LRQDVEEKPTQVRGVDGPRSAPVWGSQPTQTRRTGERGHADQRPQDALCFEHHNIIDEADLADAASRLDTKRNVAAVELTQGFRRDLGTIQPNCTKTAAEAQVNLETTVFPN